jgi:PKD repeat protein
MRRHLSLLARSAFATFLLAVFLVALSSPSPASASPPANDNFADAQAISSFPFSDSGDLSVTTLEPGEPQICNGEIGSAWYTFTASSNAPITIDESGSDGVVGFNFWQSSGVGFGGLSFVGCGSAIEQRTFIPQAGATYYIQTGSNNDTGFHLQLQVTQLQGPANDNFANATSVGSLPFTDHGVHIGNASVEPGENTFPNGAFTLLNSTVWYTITPLTSQTLTASIFLFCCTSPTIAVYSGNSLGSLTQVAGASFQQPVSFRANAGSTYYVQAGIPFVGCCDPTMDFSLTLAAPPFAQFSASPFDPSVFESVSFFDQSFDPAGLGIASQAWDLGDGTTATGCCPNHRYAADGDYTVKDTVTTTDGRSATATQTLHVRTHDVTISKLVAPSTGKVGRTVQLVTVLGNTRYPEQVEVDLLKSVPGGFTQVGSLTQGVPVMRRNQTLDFKINYTFVSDDAALGKVTFKAVARLLSARDALPGDNEVSSTPPTKVTG